MTLIEYLDYTSFYPIRKYLPPKDNCKHTRLFSMRARLHLTAPHVRQYQPSTAREIGIARREGWSESEMQSTACVSFYRTRRNEGAWLQNKSGSSTSYSVSLPNAIVNNNPQICPLRSCYLQQIPSASPSS
jgi:hypothetical protein